MCHLTQMLPDLSRPQKVQARNTPHGRWRISGEQIGRDQSLHLIDLSFHLVDPHFVTRAASDSFINGV